MFTAFAGMSRSGYLHFRYAIHIFHHLDIFSKTYHFSPGASGLAYLGLGLGCISAMVFGARFSDQIYKHVSNCLHMNGVF